MSSVTFKALIDGVHFDPKKGTVKIQLVVSSHVSIDKLTTLGPGDETVRVTLDSPQTKIEDVGLPIKIGPPQVTDDVQQLEPEAGDSGDPKASADEPTEESGENDGTA